MRVGVAGFVPERLTQARVYASLTKLELSERLGKSSSSISRWEKGDSLPEADALEAMSLALGFPTAWFSKPLERAGTPVFYRSLASATSDLRGKAGVKMDWLQELVAYLSSWLEWPDVNVPTLDVEDHRELDLVDIARAALKCREIWGLGVGPIDDLVLAAESAGIICSYTHQGNTKMDGLSQWDKEKLRPFILLADDKYNYYRSRFDLAHEIGHIVLHKGISTFDINHIKEIEAQANFFAGCLLIPEESLSVELHRYASLENMLSLKRKWKVSVAAIIYRADQLGLLSESEVLRLRKSYSARGWSKGELYDDERGPEQVRLIPRAISALLDAKIKTKMEIAQDLMVPRKELEKLCSVPEGFFSPSPKPILSPVLRLKEGTLTGVSNVVELKKK